MKLSTRSISVLLALSAAVTSLPVSALAADVEEIETPIVIEDEIESDTIIDTETDTIGTNASPLVEGVQITDIIPYDSSKNYDNGHNYKDYTFEVPADGTLKITFDAAIDRTSIGIYDDSTKAAMAWSYTCNTGGYISSGYFKWSEAAGLSSSVITCKVTKGTYIIRVRRNFDYSGYGKEGNGRIHIKAEMQKPSCPSNIQVTKATTSALTFLWGEPSDGTTYDLRYKTGSGSWKTVSKIADNTVTVTGLKSATTYTYQMRTYAGEIVGDWSEAATATTEAFPVPQNVQAVKGSKQITLSWNAVKGATGYIVKSADGKKQYTKKMITSTSYTVTGLKNSTAYKFKVYAKVDGKWYGSSTKTATPTGAPQNVNAVAGSKKITLSWDKVNGATSYVIKSADGKTQYTKSAIKTNSYTVTGLKGKTQYKFKVYAKVDGKWYASNPKTKTTKA